MHALRTKILSLTPIMASFFLAPACYAAALEPELGSVAKMASPGEHWFYTLGFLGGGSIFDADSGEMHGKIHVTGYSSGVRIDQNRGKVYVPGAFYSRGTYGERTDLVVVHDLATLSPTAEIEIPKKLAGVFNAAMINPIGDRLLGVYNMTPAMSVSIVDVEQERFVTEISTAGCALIYPLSGRRFMQICGDGTVQVIELDAAGQETARTRSRVFFDAEKDPVFDVAVARPDGWLLVSFEGLVYEVTVTDKIQVTKPWSILTDEDVEEKWRVGGGPAFAFNANIGVLFTLMHQGGPDTHEEPGTEVWAFDTVNQRRGYRIVLEAPTDSVAVSVDADPLLYIPAEGKVHVHTARTGRRLRTIEETGLFASRIQVFGEFK